MMEEKILHITNIYNRCSATGSREREREKKIPALSQGNILIMLMENSALQYLHKILLGGRMLCCSSTSHNIIHIICTIPALNLCINPCLLPYCIYLSVFVFVQTLNCALTVEKDAVKIVRCLCIKLLFRTNSTYINLPPRLLVLTYWALSMKLPSSV